MENKKKKGFFDMLIGKKEKGCCCDFELEEVPEEKADNKDLKKSNDSEPSDKDSHSK